MSDADPNNGELNGATSASDGGESMDAAQTPPPAPLEQVSDDVDTAVPVTSGNSNQLTLLFQGEVYVFDSVTPEKVQAVLLLLGGCEVPASMASTGAVMPFNQNKGFEDILSRTDIPAQRVEALIRFRQKRKERNFDKKIRYAVRREVAERMHRHKGQFAGRANPEGESASPGGDASEAVKDWKCQNCGVGPDDTPTMRRGPGGPRSLCNACGLMWANKGTFRSGQKGRSKKHSTPLEQEGNLHPELDTGIKENPEMALDVVPLDMQQEIDEALKNEVSSS
ncbi:GATA transcription factor 28-like protein [Carex littledalei]|uniref:GATA transcription factor 28-like protein n=1 Tax=Carex littledalei TaxID=544730 RepID=A0A833VT08_9POAL|nr:GATA transcription factor 28-like protein [Carex littledalei]